MATKKSSTNSNAIKLDERHLSAGLADGLTSEMTPNHLVAAITTRSVNTAFTVKKFANVDDSIEVSDYILELPPVGTRSSSRMNPLRLSPSSNSRLWVLTASVVTQASNSRGTEP